MSGREIWINFDAHQIFTTYNKHREKYVLIWFETIFKTFGRSWSKSFFQTISTRAATAGKAGKVWSFPRFWVSIRSIKKQPVKKFWGRILDLAWLNFAVASNILPKTFFLILLGKLSFVAFSKYMNFRSRKHLSTHFYSSKFETM